MKSLCQTHKNSSFCTVRLGSLFSERRGRAKKKALSAVYRLKGAAESFHRPGALHQYRQPRKVDLIPPQGLQRGLNVIDLRGEMWLDMLLSSSSDAETYSTVTT